LPLPQSVSQFYIVLSKIILKLFSSLIYMNYVPKKLNEETMNESINKSLKIPKGGNQNPYVEEEQTT
jgi:hypothetical protein